MRAVPAISHGFYVPSRFRVVVLEFRSSDEAEAYDSSQDDETAERLITTLNRMVAS